MTTQVDDIRKEKLISKKWNFKTAKESEYSKGVLVTGANSFIGSHIVRQLQQQWEGTIHLLLRAASKAEAVSKMEKAFTSWHLGDFDEENIEIHLGDVSMDLMGLPSKEFQQLKKSTGYVIHMAMTPLYHLPFHHFKRVWIPELERMIQFCGDKKYPKSLHYTSSYNANFFVTDDDFKALNSNAWQSGYAGFKWVANKAIENAFDQGLKGCIYDIPLVLGSEKNGICPMHYSIWLILDLFLKAGYFFKFKFKVFPVDVLAELIVFNMMEELEGKGLSFVRPVLSQAVTDELFSKMVANLLGLKEGDLATVREACPNKLRYDFMVPDNFYELLKKVNEIEEVLPEGFDRKKLPLLPMIFMSNLNRILTMKRKQMEVVKEV